MIIESLNKQLDEFEKLKLDPVILLGQNAWVEFQKELENTKESVQKIFLTPTTINYIKTNMHEVVQK